MGYAKRPEPTWFYAAIASLAVVIGSVLIFGYIGVNQWFESLSEIKPAAAPEVKEMAAPAVITKEVEAKAKAPAYTGGGIEGLEKIILTSKIVNNQPIDNLDEFSLSAGTIYCYTKLAGSSPEPIRHVWVDPDGAIAADIKLNIARSSAYTWSYINLYGAKAGQWEIHIKAADGTSIASKQFAVRP